MVNRGEIWWVDLPEPSTSEPGFTRPVLIVQSNLFNHSRISTVVGIALSSNTSLAAAPGNVMLPRKKTGLTKQSVANVSQIITLDKSFLREKAGVLDRETMQLIDKGMKLVLAL